MEKIERYQKWWKKSSYLLFLQKIMVTNALDLIATIAKHNIRNRKYFRLFEVAKFGRNCMSGKKIKAIAVCRKDFAIP